MTQAWFTCQPPPRVVQCDGALRASWRVAEARGLTLKQEAIRQKDRKARMLRCAVASSLAGSSTAPYDAMLRSPSRSTAPCSEGYLQHSSEEPTVGGEGNGGQRQHRREYMEPHPHSRSMHPRGSATSMGSQGARPPEGPIAMRAPVGGGGACPSFARPAFSEQAGANPGAQVIDFSRTDVSNSGLAGALTAMQQLAEDTMTPSELLYAAAGDDGAGTLTQGTALPRARQGRRFRRRGAAAGVQTDGLHELVMQAVKDAVDDAVSKQLKEVRWHMCTPTLPSRSAHPTDSCGGCTLETSLVIPTQWGRW